MITLFDLRNELDPKHNQKIIESIRQLFDEALHEICFSESSIQACTGCWSCWLMTPGCCIFSDEMTAHYPDYLNSDKVILLLSTAQGFINHRAKAFLDRTIPHYHPYIEIINQECHHAARYNRYPELYFYIESDGLTEPEEQTIEDYLTRTAFHFKSGAFRILPDLSALRPLTVRPARRGQKPFQAVEPMHKLVIYNGSPRRSDSNSGLILNRVQANLADKVEIRDLKEEDRWESWARAFPDDQNVLFFMPLYVHAMPSHVMAFMEKLRASNGSLGFFIQSGFPESSQSHYLEAYLEQLASRLQRQYLGTVIKGGVESLKSRSEKSRENLIGSFVQTLSNLVHDGRFSLSDIRSLAMPVRFGGLMSRMIDLFGLKSINAYWDQLLKANEAYDRRFDRPFMQP